MSEILDTTKFTVDGFTYTVNALDTVKARKVWFKVMGALAPTLGSLASVKSDPMGAGAQALATLVEHLSEQSYSELCDTFAANTRVELEGGREPLLKDCYRFHFSRRLSAEARWLFECIKWNFSDFLEGQALGDLRSLLASKSSAQKISTGSSTAS